jgi:hypothetical protein
VDSAAIATERATRTAELFHEAWMLLSNLDALRRQLPDPNMPVSKLPEDWNESRSYAVCVDMLRVGLRFALKNIIVGLEFRNEGEIREALLPPSAKLPHGPESYLRWLDETMGGGNPEGPR